MNKSELIDAMAKSAGLTKKDTEAALKAFVENVSIALEKGDDVSLIGFGTFSVGVRGERKGRNPKTGETVDVPDRYQAKFSFSNGFKDKMKTVK